MKKILEIVQHKPTLYEQSADCIWDDPYVSKSMLQAHLDTTTDAASRTLAFAKESVAWIANILPSKEYPSILDLGCGPGIYTELFYEKGYQVTGFDLSERSILYARQSSKNKQFTIQYLQGDYTQMKFYNLYHIITLIYCDFGVLSTETRTQLMSKIYNSLKPNGIFLFDIYSSLKYKGMQEEKDWEVCEHGFWHEDVYLMLHSFYRYDKDAVFLHQYVIVTNEELHHYNIWEHTFTLEEIKESLLCTGFRDVKFFSDMAGHPYDASKDTICVMARK